MPPNFSGLLAKATSAPAAELEPVGAEEEDAAPDPKLERVLPVAEDLLAAVKSGDASAVAEALIAAHEACAGGYSTEDEV